MKRRKRKQLLKDEIKLLTGLRAAMETYDEIHKDDDYTDNTLRNDGKRVFYSPGHIGGKVPKHQFYREENESVSDNIEVFEENEE